MLKDTFCSSPWFHIRILPEGYYAPCRWMTWEGYDNLKEEYHIDNMSIIEYMNSTEMNLFRKDFLDGNTSKFCHSCYYDGNVEGKVSGRERQLLKSGIDKENFEKTLCSSPHWNIFQYSNINQGKTQSHPVDLQIDLGNTCNSACIICPPRWSSRSGEAWEKLTLIDQNLFPKPKKFKNWSDSKETVSKFVSYLKEIENIKYIHFLGGETLYMKGFYDICDELITSGKSKDIILGTTTNCTIYDNRLERIAKEFKELHLGLSIETVTPLNDYIRWPSNINNVLNHIDKFISFQKKYNVQLSLRITPSVLSIYHIDQLFEFMIKNKITAESCDILDDPRCLQIQLISDSIRQTVITNIKNIIKKYNLIDVESSIVNRRSSAVVDQVITKTIFEYLNFLENYKPLSDQKSQQKDLVKWLTAYESLRGNKILDYLPEYEEFLRSIGYQG